MEGHEALAAPSRAEWRQAGDDDVLRNFVIAMTSPTCPAVSGRAQALLHRYRCPVLSSLHVMRVPAEVTPRAPWGVQKAPGWTTGRPGGAAGAAVVGTGVAVLGGAADGTGPVRRATVAGLVVAGGPPEGTGWLGQDDSTRAMAACSARVTHKW